MKSKFINSLLVASALLFGCEGPEGPQGLAGTTGKDGIAGKDGAAGQPGAAGQQGADGQDGKNAESNIKSTAWFKPNFTDTDVNTNQYKTAAGEIYQSYVYMTLKDKTQPLITQEVIDKGVVLIYIKSKSLLYNESEGEYGFEERVWGGISGTSSSSYFKIPERVLNKWEDFAYINYGATVVNVNNWSIYATMNTPQSQVYQNGSYVNVSTSPELLNKTNAFYRELFTINAPEMRLVTMTASAAGRLRNLDFSDYGAVKKALDLKD